MSSSQLIKIRYYFVSMISTRFNRVSQKIKNKSTSKKGVNPRTKETISRLYYYFVTVFDVAGEHRKQYLEYLIILLLNVVCLDTCLLNQFLLLDAGCVGLADTRTHLHTAYSLCVPTPSRPAASLTHPPCVWRKFSLQICQLQPIIDVHLFIILLNYS